jgi:hypothetical protein
MTDLEPNTLETALKIASEDKTLKAIGFKFGKNGINHKLNEILKYIDVKLDVAESKTIRVEGKQKRVSAYKLVSISAESILASLSE